MRNHPQVFCILAVGVVILPGCASGVGGRVVNDTRDLVVEAQVPESGSWYIAEATAADAVDDLTVDIGPMFLAEDLGVGASPVALCEGEFNLDEFL